MRDQFGRLLSSQYPQILPMPYITETVTGTGGSYVKYTRYMADGPDGKCGILRNTVTVSGATTTDTCEFAYGKWSQRASLASSEWVPVNECWGVQ